MTKTKAIVMSRVRAIHHMRPLVSTGALCAALIVVSVYAVSREVWVEMVFRNIPKLTDIEAVVSFFVYAFLHTGFMVQAFSVVAILSSLFLIRESVKALPLFVSARAH